MDVSPIVVSVPKNTKCLSGVDTIISLDAVGAPEEGFGFTNKAQPQNQRTPTFETAAFEYDGSNKDIQVMILYRR